MIGVSRIERLFRSAASLDVDRNDVKRLEDFVHRKLYDLLVVAQEAAGMNTRDVLMFADLPITKGLLKCIHDFRELDEEIELRPTMERLATLPPLDLAIGADIEERLPEIAGGLSLAVARSLRIIQPDLANPSTVHWERTFRLFDLLL